MRRGLILSLVLLAGCGGGGARPESVAKALRARLVGLDLSPRWVVCTRSAVRGVFRCNVSFGDPHVQIFCASVDRGRLRAAEWRPAVHGRQDRAASQRECADRLRAGE